MDMIATRDEVIVKIISEYNIDVITFISTIAFIESTLAIDWFGLKSCFPWLPKLSFTLLLEFSCFLVL